MTILYPVPKSVKPARRPFGLGLDAEVVPACKWATDAEYREHFEATTLSASEYRDLAAGDRAVRMELFMDAHDAELAEMGLTPARLEALARDAAELDAYASGRPL